MHKVKYYSKNDLSISYYDQRIDDVVKTLDFSIQYNQVNEILEFYNILKFREIDKNNYFGQHKQETSFMQKEINLFVKSVNETNFKSILAEVETNYLEDFWELISENLSKVSLSSEMLLEILNENNHYIHYIVRNKELVEQYDFILRTFMLEYTESAEFFLDKYEYETSKTIYLPKSITPKDIEQIFVNYIENTINPNVLEDISILQNKRIPISDEIKLSAKRKAIEKKKELFKIQHGFEYGVEVAFVNQREPKTVSVDRKHGYEIKYRYSQNWIKNNLDFPTLFNNFIYIFDFVDNEFRIIGSTKSKDLNLIEDIFQSHGKRFYKTDISFNIIQQRILAQMYAYRDELKKYDISFEILIEWFFGTYLKKEFSIENFFVDLPSKNTNFFEKCRTIFPEIDGILKKYEIFVKHKKIDEELLQISTNSKPFADYPSLIKKKYIYGKGEIFNQICYCLFSNQCMLHYSPKHKKYSRFFDLIRNENLKYDEFEKYNLEYLDFLIDNDIVYISDGIVKLKDIFLCCLLLDLYLNGYCNYYHLKKPLSEKVNILESKGWIEFRSSFFAEPEADFFDFYLNDHKYNNGLKLRNKYSHATNSPKNKQDEHCANYMIALYLIVLVIIKINDELCLIEERSNM